MQENETAVPMTAAPEGAETAAPELPAPAPATGGAASEPTAREVPAEESPLPGAADDARLAALIRSAEALRQTYPGYDLSRELRDPVAGPLTVRMLEAGIPLRTVYEGLHHAELLHEDRLRMADSIRSGRARAGELSAGPAAAPADPVYLRDRSEREAIKARMRRGERVVL